MYSIMLTNKKQKIFSIKLTNKKQKIFSKEQKGFRDGLLYSTPQKSEETRGNTITQPQSHPVPKSV